MNQPELASIIFADARILYADALEMLDSGKLRNAAEKAWGAVQCAANALLLELTGTGAATESDAGTQLAGLSLANPEVEPFRAQFSALAQELFYNCICDELYEPMEVFEADIQSTADFIAAAERLSERSIQS